MSLYRVGVSNTKTVSRTFTVNEVATDADSAMAFTVAKLNGTSVTSGNANHISTGVYSIPISLSSLDTLVITWVGAFAGVVQVQYDYVEIVGGQAHLCSVSQVRNSKPALDTTKYTTADIEAAIVETECEFEDICGQAFLPRYKRVAVDGNDDYTIALPDPFIRTVRSVSVNGVAWTAGQLSNVEYGDSGILSIHGGIWMFGRKNIIFEYEYGHDYPSPYLATAAVIRSRSRLGLTDSKVPYRAMSYSSAEGGTYRLSMPGQTTTGIPEVDATLARNMFDGGGFA